MALLSQLLQDGTIDVQVKISVGYNMDRLMFYGHSVPAADSGRAVVSYWRKYQHLVLVNHLGSLPVQELCG